MLKDLQLPDVISMSGWDLKLQKATLNLNLWIKKKEKKRKKCKISKKIYCKRRVNCMLQLHRCQKCQVQTLIK